MAEGSRRAPAQPGVVLAAACAALLIAQHVAGRTCRDALFLSSFPLSELPKVMLAAAVLGFVAVLLASRAMSRHGPGSVIPFLLLVSGVTHVAEWRLLASARELAVVLIYLHTSIIGGIAVSGFWSIVGERFDPHALRRSAGYIAAGSAFGGLFGGLVAQAFAGHGIESLLLPLAGTAVVGGAVVRKLAGSARPPDDVRPDSAGVRGVTGSSYLRTMALLVALTGLSGMVFDFAFKARVSSALSSREALVSFFAVFYTTTSVASVILQLSVARWLPARFGLGVSLAVLPTAMFGLGLLAVLMPAAWTAVVLRGSAVALETSLFRAAYEPLYAPLPTWQKRSTKTIIDVACARFGEVTGSGWVLLVASVSPALASVVGLSTGVLAAALCVLLSLRLEGGYIGELALSLRTGRVSLDPSEVEDVTTRLTLSKTGLGIDRDMLLRQIEELRRKSPPAEGGDKPVGRETLGGRPTLPPSHADPAARQAERIAALRSGDSARIRAALAGAPLELEIVSLVIPLLDHEGAADAVVLALRSVAPKVVGQLVDALLDREASLRVRRRVPRVLRACPHPRAVRGLAEALSDPEFELRYRCALALRDLVRQNPVLRPPQRLVLEAAGREIELGQARPNTPSAQSWLEDEAAEPGSREAVSTDRTLDYVFTLLGLAVDDEALELARVSLSSADAKLRGTALEYLEHVLPEPIRTRIWPYLQAGRSPSQAAKRPASEIADELKRSFG